MGVKEFFYLSLLYPIFVTHLFPTLPVAFLVYCIYYFLCPLLYLLRLFVFTLSLLYSILCTTLFSSSLVIISLFSSLFIDPLSHTL